MDYARHPNPTRKVDDLTDEPEEDGPVFRDIPQSGVPTRIPPLPRSVWQHMHDLEDPEFCPPTSVEQAIHEINGALLSSDSLPCTVSVQTPLLPSESVAIVRLLVVDGYASMVSPRPEAPVGDMKFFDFTINARPSI